ncbi:MAG: hypothetical protein QOF58_4508 [Pseudonocardiales bacterium]|jgi:probable phosphoglycerate mutase|nr:hypothetical protein [Pseudonocardiales bacterium]
MTRIIFIRHGETRHNVDLVITSGAPGGPLTERGEEQARALAQRLSDVDIAAVYSSPLTRAVQTAEALGHDVVLLDDLRECSVGDLEGKGDADSFARFDLTFEHWYRETGPDLDFPLGPNGETGTAAVARVATVVQEILRAHQGQTVAVVAHGTVLQLALTTLCVNLPPSFGYRRWIANAGTVLVDVTGQGLVCRDWSGTPVDELELT